MHLALATLLFLVAHPPADADSGAPPPGAVVDECGRGAPEPYLKLDPAAYARVIFDWQPRGNPTATEKAFDEKGRLLVQIEHSGCAHYTLTVVLPYPGAEKATPEQRVQEAIKRLHRVKARVPRGADSPEGLAAALEKAKKEGKAAELGRGRPFAHGDAIVELNVRPASGKEPAALAVTYDFPL